MCTNPDRFWRLRQRFSLSYLLKRIERFYEGKEEFLENFRDAFYISGGEPTLSPHLINIIKKINELFPEKRIICLTNGRRLSYIDYTQELLSLNANLELDISIHGHNPKIHDRITQASSSFIQTISGLRNIFRFKRPEQIIEIRIVIHQLNYKFLRQTTKFIKEEFPQLNRLVYIFFEIEGQVCKNLKTLKLTYTQLLPYIIKIYNLINYFPDVRFYHFPLCTLPPEFFPYIWRTLPSFEILFPKIMCERCNLKDLCLGVHKGYLKYVGFSEFQPITRNIQIQKSNNWHHPIEKIIN